MHATCVSFSVTSFNLSSHTLFRSSFHASPAATVARHVALTHTLSLPPPHTHTHLLTSDTLHSRVSSCFPACPHTQTQTQYQLEPIRGSTLPVLPSNTDKQPHSASCPHLCCPRLTYKPLGVWLRLGELQRILLARVRRGSFIRSFTGSTAAFSFPFSGLPEVAFGDSALFGRNRDCFCRREVVCGQSTLSTLSPPHQLCCRLSGGGVLFL